MRTGCGWLLGADEVAASMALRLRMGFGWVNVRSAVFAKNTPKTIKFRLILNVFTYILNEGVGMSAEINIQLNGEARRVQAGSLTSLITSLGLSERMIAIERNLEVVPKSQYASTLLCEGDRIEVVHMIGGG